MNVPFRIQDGNEALEKKFVAAADQEGLLQLCGHPLFGGIRVTLYNGVPDRAVERVLDFMQRFRAQHQ